jgi:hypothetical protein
MYSLSLVAALAIQASVGLATLLFKPGVDFFSPLTGGGSMLDDAGAGPVGEPLNVIISGLSSLPVLADDGFLNFARSIGFSTECLGMHLGTPQSANLGDGHGWVDQTIELRQDYGNSKDGTCLETLIGGGHFRVYRQNGSKANSGALFLACSKEMGLSEGHDIVPDGYNIGRNMVATAASGRTSFDGVNYSTTAKNITGLLAPGSEGVNHGIAQDGIVTLLTITIV